MNGGDMDLLKDIGEAIDRHIERETKLEKLLRRLEWAGEGDKLDEYFCPVCWTPKGKEHDHYCDLAILIDAKREPLAKASA